MLSMNISRMLDTHFNPTEILLIPRKIYFALSASVLFSGSYVSAQFTTQDLGPLTTSLLRYAVALVFLICLLPRVKTASLKIHKKDVMRFCLLGLSGIVGYHYFFLLALRNTVVANTAIINATSPILTGVMAALFIGERLNRKNYTGVLIAFAGVIILLSHGKLQNVAGLNINKGDAIMLLAVLSWVVYALTVKSLIQRYSGYTITFYATLTGVVLLLFLAMSEDVASQIRTISTASILAVVYMGVFASGLGYLAYNLSIREIGPTRTSSFVYSLVPVLVAILAFLFFLQPISIVMGISLVLILFGLRFMLQRSDSDKK